MALARCILQLGAQTSSPLLPPFFPWGGRGPGLVTRNYQGKEVEFRTDDIMLYLTLVPRLCPPLPIDVVYTWVNGTDPLLVREIKQLKRTLAK